MQKSLRTTLACYGDFDFSLNEPRPDISFAIDNSIDRQILSSVYQPDEDGFMQSDIAQLLTNKVRPELKEYIQNNLLKLQSPIRSQFPVENLSDEEQAFLVPSQFETLDGYTSRVRDYLKSLKTSEG